MSGFCGGNSEQRSTTTWLTSGGSQFHAGAASSRGVRRARIFTRREAETDDSYVVFGRGRSVRQGR